MRAQSRIPPAYRISFIPTFWVRAWWHRNSMVYHQKNITVSMLTSSLPEQPLENLLAAPSIGGNAVYLNGDATLLSIKSAPKPSTQKDQELVVRYYTLEYPADRLVLKANETAILDGTIPFDLPYNWVNLLYTQGTNLPVDLYVPLGL